MIQDYSFFRQSFSLPELLDTNPNVTQRLSKKDDISYDDSYSYRILSREGITNVIVRNNNGWWQFVIQINFLICSNTNRATRRG